MKNEPPEMAALKRENESLRRERDELYRLNDEIRHGYMELRYQVAIMVKLLAQAIDERNQAMRGRGHGNENPS
jgi:hypothetical protein